MKVSSIRNPENLGCSAFRPFNRGESFFYKKRKKEFCERLSNSVYWYLQNSFIRLFYESDPLIGGWRMNIHEYQGKEILRQYGVAVSNGKVAFTADEAVEAAKTLDSKVYVVKAQIHAGGRGKAGGVKIAKSLDEVRTYANELLGKVLVTHQTGPEGKEVKRLLVEEGCDIKKEYYVGVVIDRKTGRVTLMASEEGGTEIEEVAEKTPEKIFKEVVDPAVGLQVFQARRLATSLKIFSGVFSATSSISVPPSSEAIRVTRPVLRSITTPT